LRKVTASRSSFACSNLSYLPQTLTCSAFEVQIWSKFLDEYLPHTTSPATSTLWLPRWTDTIVQMRAESSLLNRIIASLCLCNIGSRSNDIAVYKTGTETYSLALRQLNRVLQTPEVASRDYTVIPAIVLMSLYEQFNGFSKEPSSIQSRNWYSHSQGVSQLLKMRGPDGYSSDFAFTMLSLSQASQFASAFAARKGTFLAMSRWRTVPWRNRTKTSRDLFYDIVFPIPGVLEKIDVALALDTKDAIPKLMEQMLQVLSELDQWKCRYLTETDASLPFETRLSHTDNTISAHDLETVAALLQFWAVNINIILNLRQLISNLPGDNQSDYTSRFTDPLTYAASILRLIPILFKYGGMIGSQATLYPIGAVRNYLDRAKVDQPDVSASLSTLLKHSVKDTEHAKFLESFLGNIPAIRGDTKLEK
jgi:hypothetical protein